MRKSGLRTVGILFMSVLLTMVTAIPGFGQPIISPIGEKTYDTQDGKFRIHYNKNVSDDYVRFVAHAFSKAREFQSSLGFKDVEVTPNTPDSNDGKVAIYIKDLIYDDKASEVVIGFGNRLQHILVTDKPEKFEKWQIYISAAHCYFEAVLASYRTNGYQSSEEYAWINDGLAKFIVLYTAMNDPEYKQYDEEYKQYGLLSKVMVDGKKTDGYAMYQVPRITPDVTLQNGITKLGSLSVSYWYYLHKIYGMKVIQDVLTEIGSYNDDSVRVMHGILSNYNTTFTQSVAGWYESLAFWNKGTFGDFSVYEGLMLVNHEMFTDVNSSELPLQVEHHLSRYGASFVSLKFDSHGPLAQIRFVNPGETEYVYAYIRNISTDKYYQQIFEVQKGYQEFWVWIQNVEINFIVIGGDKSSMGGFTIAAV